MKNQPYFTLILLTLAFISFSISETVFASRDTDRSGRLALVRQATGQESSGTVGSYSSHVDSILNQTQFETERMYVDDTFDEPLPVVVPEPIEEIAIAAANPSKGKTKSKVDGSSPDSKASNQKIKADAASVQAEDEKKREEEAKKAAQEAADAEALAKDHKQEDKTRDSQFQKNELRPSLANNPFYFSEDSRRGFEDNKSIIMSRLVQKGYTRLEAQSIVNSATSSEELVLSLMQNEDMTYGEAQDYATV